MNHVVNIYTSWILFLEGRTYLLLKGMRKRTHVQAHETLFEQYSMNKHIPPLSLSVSFFHFPVIIVPGKHFRNYTI